jgi:large subunit ribosomal protein L1
MIKVGKKHREAKEKISGYLIGSWIEGIEAVLDTAHTNFDESVDVAVSLGIDPSKGEQTVRGSVLLPHGIGKKVRVLVFAKGEHDEAAREAGADYVGADDLIEKIAGGWMEFDAAVATPDLMGKIGKIARVLGPRGLLPNKKVGTVTFDVGPIIQDLKKGRVSFRNDKGGILHAPFGRISFGAEKLYENLVALMRAINASKPSASRGKFIKKITISSTMGASVELNPSEIM